MAISIGDAVLKVGVDKKDFDKKMTGIGASIKKHQKAIGIGMATMGAAILAAGALSVKTFAAMGDEVQKMALRTGFSTEALSELRHAADLSGTSLSSLEKASKTLSGAILDAGFGLETYVRALDQLGLTYEELVKLSPEDQFLAVMEALAGVEDESKKAALAADLFGRAGTQLLPMLADGTEGLKNMRQEAHTLGIVFDQEAANKAAEFTDALTKLKGSMSGVMIQIGSFLIDALKPLIDKITEVVVGMGKWADEHKTLTKVMVFLTTALGGLLLTLAPIIIMLDSLIDVWLALRLVWKSHVIPTIGKLIIALKAKVAALLASRIATLLHIPAVWAFVTALWAQVTATLAAMAATGVLIPAAIAAVAAIALLATGVALLVENQKKQYASTNETAQAIQILQAITGKYGPLAVRVHEEVGEAVDAVTQKIRRQIKYQKELLKIVGRKFPKGLTTAELQLYAPLIEGVTVPGQVPGTAGYYKALGVPGFQAGGIISSPTLAMLGERGPEAVIPLDKGGMVNIFVELDGRVIAKAVGQPLVDEIRLKTGMRM